MQKVWTFHSDILMRLHKSGEIRKGNEKTNLLYAAMHYSNQEFAQGLSL